MEKMAQIAELSPELTVERHFDAMGEAGFDVVNLRCVNSTPHVDLGGQMILHAEERGIVHIEMRARRWHPDDPSYATYVAEARRMFIPLLGKYNQSTRKRLRLSITKPRSLEPRLPPASAKLFEQFAFLANKRALHPLDWRRFYRFIRQNRMKKRLHAEDLVRMLTKEGFKEDYARRIAEIHDHLWDFHRNE